MLLDISIPPFSVCSWIIVLLNQVQATSSAGDDAERTEVESDVKVEDNNNDKKKKKIFVAGSTGRTGKRIVERLLSGGYGVRAGALDLEKARSGLPQDPDLQIVSLSDSELLDIFRKFLVFGG